MDQGQVETNADTPSHRLPRAARLRPSQVPACPSQHRRDPGWTRRRGPPWCGHRAEQLLVLEPRSPPGLARDEVWPAETRAQLRPRARAAHSRHRSRACSRESDRRLRQTSGTRARGPAHAEPRSVLRAASPGRHSRSPATCGTGRRVAGRRWRAGTTVRRHASARRPCTRTCPIAASASGNSGARRSARSAAAPARANASAGGITE